MKSINDRIRKAAESAVPSRFRVAISKDIKKGVTKRSCGLDRSKAAELIRRGFLFEDSRAYYPGIALKMAVSPTALTDVCDALTPLEFDTIHEESLRLAVVVRRTREIGLLHAHYMTSHYFDCDTFISKASSARKVAVDTLASLISALPVDYLACCISPEGLIGTYPVCVHLALTMTLDVCTMVPDRRGNIRFVGDVRPKKGKALVIHDVLTTGTSILRLHEQLHRAGASCLGALVIYDRCEGGREKLIQKDISVVSLMSLNSFRRYCDRVIKTGAPTDLKLPASRFLEASRRLNLVPLKFNQKHIKTVRIGLVVGKSPLLASFDSAGRLRTAVRSRQLGQVERSVYEAVQNGCNLVVFPELTLPYNSKAFLARQTARRNLIIIGGMEYDSARRNVAAIAIDGKLLEQAKRVKSPYDFEGMTVGDTVHVFRNTCIGNFAVLICADQIDEDAIRSLSGKIDFLVVVSRNKAINTFASIAAGDAYRHYMCVVVANDQACGDSLLAAPVKGRLKLRRLRADPKSGIAYCEFHRERMLTGAGDFLQRIRYETGLAKEVR